MGILNNHLISRRSVIAAGGLVAAEFLAPHTVDAAEFNSVDIPQINNSGRELVDLSAYSPQEIEEYSLQLAKQEAEALIAKIEKSSPSLGLLRARPTYVNEYGPATYTNSGFRFVSGQPARGYSFSHGGELIVALSGGSSISISFGFPLKYGGTIGVSVSFARANAVSGVTVRIPAGGRKKVKMNLEYVSTPYTVYRVDSNGKKHFYTRNHSFPIICGHDYRVVKA